LGSRSSAKLLPAATFALGVLAGGAADNWIAAQEPGVAEAAPASGQAAGAPARVAAEVLQVIDGDTFEARAHVWPGIEVTTKVRLRGIDAPELKGACAQERMQAEAAREALRAVLSQGVVGLSDVTIDKYGGRVLANAATRLTADVSSAMLANGLVRPYAGGRRAGWCESAARE
jgi:endonuclease YncB( thermonuclease family)